MPVSTKIMPIRKLLRSNRGEGYIDIVIIIFVAVLVIALAVNVYHVFVAKQHLDLYASELCREVEIAGRVGSEAMARIQKLNEETGLAPQIRWSRTGNIQINEEFSLELTCTTNIGLWGDFGSFPITLKAKATGRSERYWKL